jgi:two-component system cell cycle response regulator
MADFAQLERTSGAGRGGGPRFSSAGSARRLAIGVVATAVAADAVRRCLRRTSRLSRATRELAVMARTDPLTGLPNRRHLEEHLAAAVSAARRHHHPLSVLFLDVDNFKHVNDDLGYEAGDDVLRAVGERMRSAVRTEDVVGRWGGEEFVAVVPTTDVDGAVSLAERIRSTIEADAVTSGDSPIPVTVSIGCACGTPDPLDLIRRASRALRQAKRHGKNRVVAAPPVLP